MHIKHVVSSDCDRAGVYFEEKLFYTGSSSSVDKWLSEITLGQSNLVDKFEVDAPWLENLGSFPPLFNEIAKEKFV